MDNPEESKEQESSRSKYKDIDIDTNVIQNLQIDMKSECVQISELKWTILIEAFQQMTYYLYLQ